MMTEEEAKTKICPALMQDRKQIYNRCEASACMAWRWGDAPREQMRNYHDAPTVTLRHEGVLSRAYEGGWQYHLTDIDHDGRKFDIMHRRAAYDAPKAGFCGLAGKVDPK